MNQIQRSKVYFASDMHLGAPYHSDPREIEQKVVDWLLSITPTARALILVGDIFDYWFEYKTVVPKGYTRLFGTLARMSDMGVEIHFFTGNHDIWTFGYLEEELGIKVHKKETRLVFDGRVFLITHGDELEVENKSFQRLRKVFHSPFCQKLYALIHPDLTLPLAQGWSKKSRENGSRKYETDKVAPYRGEDQEYLVRYAKEVLKREGEDAPDFFIFGHRHLMLDLQISRKQRVVILGDWIHHFSFGVWDGNTFVLDQLENAAL